MDNQFSFHFAKSRLSQSIFLSVLNNIPFRSSLVSCCYLSVSEFGIFGKNPYIANFLSNEYREEFFLTIFSIVFLWNNNILCLSINWQMNSIRDMFANSLVPKSHFLWKLFCLCYVGLLDEWNSADEINNNYNYGKALHTLQIENKLVVNRIAMRSYLVNNLIISESVIRMIRFVSLLQYRNFFKDWYSNPKISYIIIILSFVIRKQRKFCTLSWDFEARIYDLSILLWFESNKKKSVKVFYFSTFSQS